MEEIESFKIERNIYSVIKTGINGFDDLFQDGGLPSNISILISGTTGSGKSILCRQICHNILQKNEIYLD